MIGALLRTLAGSGERARLSILIFHRVLAVKDPLFPEIPDIAQFRAAMSWVKQWFSVLTLPEASVRLRAGTLPPAALVITFDDGYADNAVNAAPVLRELNLPATFFVASGFVDGGRMWNDTVIEALRAGGEFINLAAAGLGTYDLSTAQLRRAAIDQILHALKHRPPGERAESVAAIEAAVATPLRVDLMMTQTQLRELSDAEFTIGAHTVSHPILQRLDDAAARSEIADSKAQLEAMTGKPVQVFAYPNGVPGRDFSISHVQMVRDAGFEAACTTAWGVADAATDLLQLPRFTPWDRTPLRFGLRMAGNLRRAQPALTA